VLLVDSEGISGIDENVNHDSHIFLLSLLISSYFIYNSVGSIDENALNNLQLIINLGKDIFKRQSESLLVEEDITSQFPRFLWVVRDFSLRMVDKAGNALTEGNYLEKALEVMPGDSEAVQQKNSLRRQISTHLKYRDCATLVRPVEDEKDLQQLNSLADEELRPEFLVQVKALRSKIFS